MILRHLADCRATDALREDGRSHYTYVKDERRKRKSHDENEDDETIPLIPST